MWRQGDIFMAAVSDIPERAEKLEHGVLAEGEITGHAHRIADPRQAELYRHSGRLYLRVIGEGAAIDRPRRTPRNRPAARALPGLAATGVSSRSAN